MELCQRNYIQPTITSCEWTTKTQARTQFVSFDKMTPLHHQHNLLIMSRAYIRGRGGSNSTTKSSRAAISVHMPAGARSKQNIVLVTTFTKVIKNHNQNKDRVQAKQTKLTTLTNSMQSKCRRRANKVSNSELANNFPGRLVPVERSNKNETPEAQQHQEKLPSFVGIIILGEHLCLLPLWRYI